jgi:hypothetical protein
MGSFLNFNGNLKMILLLYNQYIRQNGSINSANTS